MVLQLKMCTLQQRYMCGISVHLTSTKTSLMHQNNNCKPSVCSSNSCQSSEKVICSPTAYTVIHYPVNPKNEFSKCQSEIPVSLSRSWRLQAANWSRLQLVAILSRQSLFRAIKTLSSVADKESTLGSTSLTQSSQCKAVKYVRT